MGINNSDMRRCVQCKEEFTNNNGTVHAEHRTFGDEHRVYVVFSYGTHFPMYLYDYEWERWFGNDDKYSVTTSRHQSQCCPSSNVIYVDTHTMHKLVCGNRNDVGDEILNGLARMKGEAA